MGFSWVFEPFLCVFALFDTKCTKHRQKYFAQFVHNFLQKSVDKQEVVWYNSQAVAERRGERSLKIEQQEISTKLKISVNYLVNYLREILLKQKVKEQVKKLETDFNSRKRDKIQ